MNIPLRHYVTLLAEYLKPQWQSVVVLFTALLCSIGLGILQPHLMQRFIDSASADRHTSTMIGLGLAFLVAALATQALNVLQNYIATNVGLIATNALRADLMLHCLRLDPFFHHAHTPGEMIERIDGDVTALGAFFSDFVTRVMSNALFLLAVLVALFVVDWHIGLAMSVFSIAAFAAINRFGTFTTPYYAAERQASADLMGFIEERLSGAEDIRANGAVSYVIRGLAKHSREMFRRRNAAFVMGFVVFYSSLVLVAIGTMIGLAVSGILYVNGVVSLGTVYLVYAYTQMLSEPIQQLGRELQNLQRASASIGRVQALLRLHSDIRDGARPLPTGLLDVKFEHVSFGYGSDVILKDVSFSIPAGARLGLLGHTGSGKTTITRLLLRLYDPSSGTITLGGTDLRDLYLTNLRMGVGMVTQDVQLFNATVRDNITFFDKSIGDDRILEVLRDLGLTDWLNNLSDGLNTFLAPGGSSLSAGQAQLLALTRVFVKDPALVILDEASSRLDPVWEQLIERATDRLLQGRTGIIIAHRLETVRRVDHLLILDDGRIVESGRREALMNDPNSLFAHLLQIGHVELTGSLT